MVLGKLLGSFYGTDKLMPLSGLLSVPPDTPESISKTIIQIGTPEVLRSVVEEAPLLGFLEILGLAPRFLTIYSIIVTESYLRINHYRIRLQK